LYSVTVQRSLSQNRDQSSAIDTIVSKALARSKGNWRLKNMASAPPVSNSGWVFTYALEFEKYRGRLNDKELMDKEWLTIVKTIDKAGRTAPFSKYPWEIGAATGNIDITNLSGNNSDEYDEAEGGVHHALSKNSGITLQEVRERSLPLIDELLASDTAISESEYFKRIFGRNAQIRTVLSSIKSFMESDGQRRNHLLLYGLPACAKTQILTSVADLLGQDAVLRLDATSTTPAAIYRIYFEEFKDIEPPPFVILEEAEKTLESSLLIWLGALDERGELRKIKHREMKSREVKLLCLATVNDKEQFDKLMGGTISKPGALSSRFVHQLMCPRPDRNVLRRILLRDIFRFGGSNDWVDPALELADVVGTNDPRQVLGFLDGGRRLLTGEYQRDILNICGKEDKIEQIISKLKVAA
jgi:hypothetical protein